MTCDCIKDMDAQLLPHNTKLEITFGFSRVDGSTSLYPLIGTTKVEKRVRKGPALAIPTFCPFCGVRYVASEIAELAPKDGVQ